MRRTDIGKDPDAGKDWGQEEKGPTEDEMVGWHHRLNGHGFGWTPAVGDGQGGLVCCSSWGHKELDMTERLSWNELGLSSWWINIWTNLLPWSERCTETTLCSSNYLSFLSGHSKTTFPSHPCTLPAIFRIGLFNPTKEPVFSLHLFLAICRPNLKEPKHPEKGNVMRKGVSPWKKDNQKSHSTQNTTLGYRKPENKLLLILNH